MTLFNKNSFILFDKICFTINAIQIHIISQQLLIYENVALPWVVYGSIFCIMAKIINSLLIFYLNHVDEYEKDRYKPPLYMLVCTTLNYFFHACFFLSVQVFMGKSTLCLEVLWNLILIMVLCASIPLN